MSLAQVKLPRRVGLGESFGLGQADPNPLSLKPKGLGQTIRLESKGGTSTLCPQLSIKGNVNGSSTSTSMEWYLEGDTPFAKLVKESIDRNPFKPKQVMSIVIDTNTNDTNAYLSIFYSSIAMDEREASVATEEEKKALKGLARRSLCSMLRAMLSLGIVKPGTILGLVASGKNLKTFVRAKYDDEKCAQILAFIDQHSMPVIEGYKSAEHVFETLMLEMNATIRLVNYYKSLGFVETEKKHNIIEDFILTSNCIDMNAPIERILSACAL